MCGVWRAMLLSIPASPFYMEETAFLKHLGMCPALPLQRRHGSGPVAVLWS